MPPYPGQHNVPQMTFNAPPLDHGLSVPGLYEYHAQHSPDRHPVFTYANRDTGEPHSITISEAWDRIGAVTKIASKQLSTSQVHGEPSERARLVISVLALFSTSVLPITRRINRVLTRFAPDALSYIYLIVALMSLGYAVFPLAPANDPEAIARLLETKAVGTACRR